tara:strand:+ start:33525 stop:34640 length:1116 start_codon:yes stop_codon:yes gene_type:complete
MTIQTPDLKNAKRYLTIQGIDKNGLDDAEIISAAIEAGWMPSRDDTPAPSLEPVSIPPQVMPPAPRVNAPANDATAKALAALMASLQSSTPLDEARIIELIQQHSQPVITVETNNIETKATVKVEGAHKLLERVLKRLNASYNVYLFGAAGSGKTTLSSQCATALNIPFYHTGALLQKYELTGYMDAGGNFVKTGFYDAMKNGGLFLFDEVDASSVQSVIAFNMAVENKMMTFPNGEIVKAHKDFKVIAAANTNGQGATQQYKRNALDGASLDRFTKITMSYDLDLELRLAIAEYNRVAGNETNDTLVTNFVRRVQRLRATAQDKRIDVIISPRTSIRGAGILAMGDTAEMALDECFGVMLSADQKSQLGL